MLKNPIYRTERTFRPRDAAYYRIPLSKGTYRVTLYFAELWYRAPNCRRFDVKIEGEEVLTDFDPYSPEPVTSIAREWTSEVEDGVLEIAFLRRKGWPKISAIKIERCD